MLVETLLWSLLEYFTSRKAISEKKIDHDHYLLLNMMLMSMLFETDKYGWFNLINHDMLSVNEAAK